MPDFAAGRVEFIMKNNLDNRLFNLDILRGLAALIVCFYHFRRDMFSGLYNSIASYGLYGVDVFFVISGFVIPFALHKSKYSYHKTLSFWLSRFVRLYPAYFFASAIGIGLWYASTLVPGFRGAPPPPVMLNQILSNLFLICDLTGQKWFLGVAWTLAIEAQYYVLIALMFPLLTNSRHAIQTIAVSTWILFPLLSPNSFLVFHWTTLFGMGLLIMLYQTNMISMRMLAIGLVLCFGTQWLTRGGASAVTGLGTALFIFLAPPFRFSGLLIWIGGISYSLYLLHQPFGGRVINFFERYPDSWCAIMLGLPLAMAGSIGIAFIFFKFVEWPSHQLARKIKETNAKK